MSAVAGCIWLDGRPAREEDLLASAAAARHRARTPFRFRSANAVALGYAADARDSCQPFHDPASGVTLIVDGCIDNLDDVAGELEVNGDSDADIVVAAWRRWGVGAGARLLGDFLLIVHEEIHPDGDDLRFWSAIGLAVSHDGGGTFEYVGRVVAPAIGADDPGRVALTEIGGVVAVGLWLYLFHVVLLAGFAATSYFSGESATANPAAAK